MQGFCCRDIGVYGEFGHFLFWLERWNVVQIAIGMLKLYAFCLSSFVFHLLSFAFAFHLSPFTFHL